MDRSIITTLGELAGAGFIIIGTAMIALPLGIILLGVTIMGLAYAGGRK